MPKCAMLLTAILAISLVFQLSNYSGAETDKSTRGAYLGNEFKDRDQIREKVFSEARRLLIRWPLKDVLLPEDPLEREAFINRHNGVSGYTYDIRMVERIVALGDEAVGPLLDLLASPHPVHRVFAIEVLYKIHSDRSILILAFQLSDEHPIVRAYCTELIESHFSRKRQRIPWDGSQAMIKNSKSLPLFIKNQKIFIKWYVQHHQDVLWKQLP